MPANNNLLLEDEILENTFEPFLPTDLIKIFILFQLHKFSYKNV